MAFNIRLRFPNKTRKTKSALVEEVCATISADKASQSGAMGDQTAKDEMRRANRLLALRSHASVEHAQLQLPWLGCQGASAINEVREQILLYECPEELRLAVVAEFISKTRRVPSTAGSRVEFTAARYLGSALERRHVSTATGEQLTLDQCTAWEQCLKNLPVDQEAPQWQVDPSFGTALDFFNCHGHLTPQKLDGGCQAPQMRSVMRTTWLAHSTLCAALNWTMS